MHNYPYFIDDEALANLRSGTKSTKFYALRHKASGLYFHKSTKRYGGPFFTASWPMMRQKSAWTTWLKDFGRPADWELVEYTS